jgi:hypothetical protein
MLRSALADAQLLMRLDALAACTLTAPHSMLAYLTLSAECEAAHFYRGGRRLGDSVVEAGSRDDRPNWSSAASLGLPAICASQRARRHGPQPRSGGILKPGASALGNETCDAASSPDGATRPFALSLYMIERPAIRRLTPRATSCPPLPRLGRNCRRTLFRQSAFIGVYLRPI